MPFNTPTFRTLKAETDTLEPKYSTFIGRYIIVEPRVQAKASISSLFEAKVPEEKPDPTPQNPPSALAILIANTQGVITCLTKRESHRNVFVQLLGSITVALNGKDEKAKRSASLLLLGALLHRYFRLIQEYEDYNVTLKVSKTWGLCDVRSCRLFLAIRTALGLPRQVQIKKIDEYLAKDLQLIDALTRYTALQVFRDNMYKIGEESLPLYMEIPHFQEDGNFVKHLDQIFEEQQKCAAPIMKQYKAIHYIQSVAAQVVTETERIEAELLKWGAVFQQKYPNFANFAFLSQELIEKHMETQIPPGSLREYLIDILYMETISSDFAVLTHETFRNKMRQCLYNTMSLTLVAPIF